MEMRATESKRDSRRNLQTSPNIRLTATPIRDKNAHKKKRDLQQPTSTHPLKSCLTKQRSRKAESVKGLSTAEEGGKA